MDKLTLFSRNLVSLLHIALERQANASNLLPALETISLSLGNNVIHKRKLIENPLQKLFENIVLFAVPKRKVSEIFTF